MAALPGQPQPANADTSQTLYHGCGSISAIANIANLCKARRVLVVTGKHSFENSGAAAAIDRHLNTLDIVRFSDFEVNPRLEDALRGIALTRRHRPDLVIAVGGGSVIDMGKVITVLSAQPGDDHQTTVKNSSITRKGAPLVAVPTTSGSGSEATHFAAIYLHGKKCSLAHQCMLPDYTVIDPELTYRTGPYQTAVSGMDALCQAVESFWSVDSTEQSRAFSREALSTILPALEDAVLVNSQKAKRKMAHAAHYAGKAINIAKTTAPHALSYPLTSRYSIPHGHAAALMLGRFFLINEAKAAALIDRRGAAFFSQILGTLYRMLGCSDALSCTESWYQRMRTIGLETDIKRLGIADQRDYDEILDSVNQERLSNHPLHLTRSLLEQVLKNDWGASSFQEKAL